MRKTKQKTVYFLSCQNNRTFRPLGAMCATPPHSFSLFRSCRQLSRFSSLCPSHPYSVWLDQLAPPSRKARTSTRRGGATGSRLAGGAGERARAPPAGGGGHTTAGSAAPSRETAERCVVVTAAVVPTSQWSDCTWQLLIFSERGAGEGLRLRHD